MKGRKQAIALTAIVTTLTLFSMSACTVFTTSGAGRDGRDGEGFTLEQCYEKAKAEGLVSSWDEFFHKYCNYTEEGQSSYYMNQSLQSAVTVCTSYSVKKTIISGGGIFGGGIAQTVTEYGLSQGSGVFYDIDVVKQEAYVITNSHVIYQYNAVNPYGNSISLYLYGQDAFRYNVNEQYIPTNDYAINATVVGVSTDYDIALLKVSGEEFGKIQENIESVREVSLSSEWEATMGETVYAIGNSEGEGMQVSKGIIRKDSGTIEISGLTHANSVNSYRVLTTDAAINSGNSGGGLFNNRGELVGIVNAKMAESDTDNMGYVLPVSMVRGIVQSMIAQQDEGKLHKADLSIQYAYNDIYTVFDNGKTKIRETVAVYTEPSATSISYGKLHMGDILESAHITRAGKTVVGETQITRSFVLDDLLFWVQAGDTLHLTVTRSGQKQEVAIAFTDYSHGFTILN